MKRWYLVHAKTQRETVAERHLARQGFETFLPKEERIVRHARRVQTRLKALFPGYLFVAFDPDADRWRPIESTTGVVRLVRHGERPSPAPDGLVEAMLDAVDAAGALAPPTDALDVGDRVRVRQGAFEGFSAEVVSLAPPDRVRLLFDVMQTHAPVEMKANAVVRIGGSARR